MATSEVSIQAEVKKAEEKLETDGKELLLVIPADSWEDAQTILKLVNEEILEKDDEQLVLVTPKDSLEGEECHDSYGELQLVTTSTNTLPLKDDTKEKLFLMMKIKSHMSQELNDTKASLRAEREMRKALEAKLAETEQQLKLLEEKQKLNEAECEMEDLDQLKLKALETYEIPIKKEAVKCESSVQCTCTISGKSGDSLIGDCGQYEDEGIQESDTAKRIFVTDDISCLLDIIDQKSAVCVLHRVYQGRSQHEEQCNIAV